MGRPPHGGGPVFRFTHAEVAEMEACLQGSNNVTPSRETIEALANKFSASADRAGKIVVQTKQVWNWFQNRRYAQRAKTQRSPAKLGVTSANREDLSTYRNAANSVPILTPAPSPAPVSAPAIASAHTPAYVSDISQMEFEAKSVRDGAWYDVATFLSHRMFESGDPEVLVRFTGFGVEEDEWVNVRKCVRLRSLPCEPSECVVVLPGDLILCFQEGKDQALYFDAHVLDAQRRRHDVRGCRCRFLVRYAHDQSEEIVPLRKICRRPETDYRLQILHASKALGPVDTRTATKDPGSSKGLNLSVQIPREPHKLVDTNTDQLVTAVASAQEPSAAESAVPMATESVGIATPVVTQASQVVAGDVGETVQQIT